MERLVAGAVDATRPGSGAEGQGGLPCQSVSVWTLGTVRQTVFAYNNYSSHKQFLQRASGVVSEKEATHATAL